MIIIWQLNLFSIQELYELEPTQRYDDIISVIDLDKNDYEVNKRSRFSTLWHSIIQRWIQIRKIKIHYLFWLLKENMYAISTETMRELNAKNLYTNQTQPFRWSHITMVGLIYASTPIFDYIVDLIKIQSIIFLIILGSIFIGFRFYYHRY